VDLAAPGRGIFTTANGGGYTTIQGTSMAAPQVTAAAALLFSVKPLATYAEVRDAILNNVDPVASLVGVVKKGGTLDVKKALDSFAPTDVTIMGDPDGWSANDTITIELDATQQYLVGRIGTEIVEWRALSSVSSITVYGFGGNDTISINSAVNIPTTIYGGTGNDDISGGSGDDKIYGEDGNDTIKGNNGADNILAGTGIDTVSYYGRTGGVSVTFDGVANDGTSGEGDYVRSDAENINGGNGADIIDASMFTTAAINNVFHGYGGNDTLRGGLGNDTLYGDTGADRIVGNAGQDIMYGGDDNDTIFALDGERDSMYGQAGDDSIGDRDVDLDLWQEN